MDLAGWWQEVWTRLALDRAVLGNSIERWLAAAAVVLAATVGLWLVRSVLSRRAEVLASRLQTGWTRAMADLAAATKTWFLWIVAVYAGSLLVDLAPRAQDVVQTAAIIALLVQGAVWGTVLVGDLIADWTAARRQRDPASLTLLAAVGVAARIALWTVAALLILENLGVQVTALVAGLGVGGIAVALAAQTILGDLFASLSIVVDKPFLLGDFVIVGETLGTVERIGLKSTHIRSLSGELIVIPNNDLLKSRIRNFKRMQERRVLFKIGVTYQTPPEKLAAIGGLLREIIEGHERVRFDRAHFQGFGDFALLFEIVYYVLAPEYGVYMDIQQSINLEISRRFAAEGIDFAYPTQTVYVQPAAADAGENA